MLKSDKSGKENRGCFITSYMGIIDRVFSKLKGAGNYKKIGIALLALLLLWFGIRSCRNVESLKDHVFFIAADNKWYPISLLGKEQYMQGFTTELLQEISREEGFKFRFMTVGSAQLFDSLDRGIYDGVISTLMPDVVRREKYLFSDPYYLVGPVLVVPTHSKIKGLNDLDGKSVGIRRGSPAVFVLSGYPGILLVTFDNMTEALDRLLSDRLDGVIVDSMIAHTYTQGIYANQLKVVTNPLLDEGFRLIAKHGRLGEHLIEKFDAGLKKVKEKGIYKQLLNKWELIDTEIIPAE